MEGEILYRTERNGFQMVKGEWMYVYTNGSISKGGFRKDICSGVKGAYIPETAVVELVQIKGTVNKLFQIFNRNYKIYYPLFLMNIMAITNGYFNTIGEPYFMKLTLWLDGPSGIGKTSLTRAAGTYTFQDENLHKEFVSATEKRSNALKCLERSSGTVCILDDIKEENVQSRKNSVRNIVDDFIRSVFQGRMTDSTKLNSEPNQIDACAIINGEYMDTKESQNARMLCLRMQEFISEKNNLDGIIELQKNPLWLTTVCAGYIQWLLTMMQEESFPKMLKGKLKELRNGDARYSGLLNAIRLNENQYMMEMAAFLVDMYFHKIGMPEKFTHCFCFNAGTSIQELCDSTFGLLGGETAVMMRALDKLFGRCKIRKAEYREIPFYCYEKYRYYQEEFWINEGEEFVLIENYKKSLLEKNHNENDEYDESPCLIIREEVLLRLLKVEIEDLVGEGKAVSPIADKVICNLPKMLKKMQIIFRKYRADDKWGRTAVEYPIYRKMYRTDERRNKYTREWEMGQITVCDMSYDRVIQMNTGHPCVKVLLGRLDNNEEIKNGLEDVGEWEEESEDKEKAYMVRKRFMNSKSLYRE